MLWCGDIGTDWYVPLGADAEPLRRIAELRTNARHAAGQKWRPFLDRA